MKNKRQLIEALAELGCTVLDQNGLLTVFTESGIMYLRSRLIYSKPWLFLHCYTYRNELFEGQDWRAVYRYITSNQKSNNMQQTIFTNGQVRAYLSKYYVPTFTTKGAAEDHFYNHRNRKTIALPSATVQTLFTERQVVDMFMGTTELPACIEVVRLKQHIINQQK